jgi:phosphopantetheinyl transferase
VSIACLGEIAVAVAAERRDVGIALERIEPIRGAAADISLSEAEMALVRGHGEAEARARLLGAKRAAARVKGRATTSANLHVREYGQQRFLIGDLWVETRRHGELIISWTQP